MDLRIPLSERDHVRGSRDGSVTLVEYGDFDCHFCREAYPVVRELLAHFGHELLFVFRHNPRGELHPHAHIAARASEAAAEQEQFWAMHDLLFTRARGLAEPAILSYAEELGLELERFASDLNSKAIAARVREDEVGGLHSGVIGTPTFFLDGTHFRDKPDFDTLARAIDVQVRAHPSAKDQGANGPRAHHHHHHRPPRSSERVTSPQNPRAFLTHPHSTEPISELLGEEFVEAVTSGGDEGDGAFTEVVPEESGGPFVETTARTEFARDHEPPNIREATREPFPKT